MEGLHGLNLEAQFTIVDYSLRKKLIKLFEETKTPLLLLTHGIGSADKSIYDILGYGEAKKILAISIQTRRFTDLLMKKLGNEMNFNKKGTGIAFTISLSSVSNSLLKTINRQVAENFEIGSEDMALAEGVSHHLVITVVNAGCFEQVMELAKEEGATGGTSIHAHGLGSEETVKYLGITIQPEKEIVLILVQEEIKTAVMEKITKNMGLNTPGQGVCFSLPVNQTLGIGMTGI